VALDAPTRERSYALAEYAIVEEQKPGKLEIEAAASQKQQQPLSGERFLDFVINLRINFPNVIRTIRVSKSRGQLEPSENPGEIKVFERKDIQKRMSFDITFNPEIQRPADEMSRASTPNDLFIAVALQPFMCWNPTPWEPMSEGQSPIISWPDIQKHTFRHWEMGIYLNGQVDQVSPTRSRHKVEPTAKIKDNNTFLTTSKDQTSADTAKRLGSSFKNILHRGKD
jgi:hypothetical protein